MGGELIGGSFDVSVCSVEKGDAVNFDRQMQEEARAVQRQLEEPQRCTFHRQSGADHPGSEQTHALSVRNPRIPGDHTDARSMPKEPPSIPRCGSASCVFAMGPPIDNKISLLILQHPQEQDRLSSGR